jgi:hypothetical protein
MRRLIKRTARYIPKQEFDVKRFISKDGLEYVYNVRIVGNEPRYSIIINSAYDSSSLYDGDDFEGSFKVFCELAIALKGVSFAEDLYSTKKHIEDKINKINTQPRDSFMKYKHLFLGDSDMV